VSERIAGGNESPADRRPTGDAVAPPGRRALVAVIVLTGVVLVFAAALAFWMYWLQG
jgi:hypothetical protein